MKKKSSENDQLTGHFQSFFIYLFFDPPTLTLEKISRKSTNKKILALLSYCFQDARVPELPFCRGKKSQLDHRYCSCCITECQRQHGYSK